MGIFQEYLNSKGKVEDGKVDVHGDRTDPMTPPTKPPGDSGHKPYSASDGKSTKKSEKGFGDQGDKDLIFNYDTEGKGKSPAKIPTAEQRFLSNELVPLVRESVSKDPLMVESLILEFKRNGLLHLLVAEMMEHRETYNHIAQLMKSEEYGPEVCRKLHSAMNEEVASPFHAQMQDEPDEDDGEETVGADDEEDMDMGMGDEDLGDDLGDFDDMDMMDMGMGDDLEFDGYEDDEAPEGLEDDEMAGVTPGMFSNMDLMRAYMRAMMSKQ